MYKILIIEDDELISKKLESFLKSWNYDINRVVDFYNVMDAFQSFNPDLVLMDITLPYLNGYLWTEKIREESKVPIIFISSATDNMSIVLGLCLGGVVFWGVLWGLAAWGGLCAAGAGAPTTIRNP